MWFSMREVFPTTEKCRSDSIDKHDIRILIAAPAVPASSNTDVRAKAFGMCDSRLSW